MRAKTRGCAAPDIIPALVAPTNDLFAPINDLFASMNDFLSLMLSSSEQRGHSLEHANAPFAFPFRNPIEIKQNAC